MNRAEIEALIAERIQEHESRNSIYGSVMAVPIIAFFVLLQIIQGL